MDEASVGRFFFGRTEPASSYPQLAHLPVLFACGLWFIEKPNFRKALVVGSGSRWKCLRLGSGLGFAFFQHFADAQCLEGSGFFFEFLFPNHVLKGHTKAKKNHYESHKTDTTP